MPNCKPMEILDLPTTVSSKEVYTCPYFKVVHDQLSHPGGGSSDYFVIEFPRVAGIIAERNGKFLMVSQYRHPIKTRTIEFPMGRVDKNETSLEAANRELSEEAGFEAAELLPLFTHVSFIGQANHRIDFFLAKELTESIKQLDPGEYNLTSLWMTAQEIDQAIADDLIIQSETIAAWYKYQLSQNTSS